MKGLRDDATAPVVYTYCCKQELIYSSSTHDLQQQYTYTLVVYKVLRIHDIQGVPRYGRPVFDITNNYDIEYSATTASNPLTV